MARKVSCYFLLSLFAVIFYPSCNSNYFITTTFIACHFLNGKSELVKSLDCQRLAELIVKTGLPGTSDTLKGLKEGSYWKSIPTTYENGVPGSRSVKAIYHVSRSKYVVDLVTKTLEGKVRISACCYVFMAPFVMGLIG